MKNRIHNTLLRNRIVSPAEAAETIQDGMTVAIGGYTSSGYPKAVIRELARHRTAGEPLRLHFISGSNTGPLDTLIAKSDIALSKTPMIESREMSAAINANHIDYCEQQMNKMPRLIQSGCFGPIHTAIIEALEILEDGSIIPTSSVGMVPELLEAAESVIVEINMSQPTELIGMHDIYLPKQGHPIPLIGIGQRIGRRSIPIDPRKIKFITASNEPDETFPPSAATNKQLAIADNLFNFLEDESRRSNWKTLPPLQTGFGNLASEIVFRLQDSAFKNIEFFCGGLQEANLSLLLSGKAIAATCSSIQMTPKVISMLQSAPEAFRDSLIIRNGSVVNNSEIISRIAPITLTSGIEMDIYGNVNSSHIAGSKVVNGLGGGANFAENSGLSILILAADGKNGKLSTIVPMVSHQDISEHDIDVVVTEYGVADLRGKSDRKRAEAIIQNCTGLYREALFDYYRRACLNNGHHPVLLEEAFQWHKRYLQTGTMEATENPGNHISKI